MDKSELFKKIKEENKNQEAMLNSKLSEGSQQLKEMLFAAKSDAVANQLQSGGNKATFEMKEGEEGISQNDTRVDGKGKTDEGVEVNERKGEAVETFSNNQIESNRDNNDIDNNEQQEDELIEEEGCIKIRSKNHLNNQKELEEKDTTNKEQKKKKRKKGKGRKQVVHQEDSKRIADDKKKTVPIKTQAIPSQMQPSLMINSITSLSREENAIDSNKSLSPQEKAYIDTKHKLKEKEHQYARLSNQVELLKKQRNVLQQTLQQHQLSSKRKTKSKPNPQSTLHKTHSPQSQREISERMKREIFKGIGTRKTLLNEFVGKVAERSLFLYRNNHCQTCSVFLSQGKSTQACPKCH